MNKRKPQGSPPNNKHPKKKPKQSSTVRAIVKAIKEKEGWQNKVRNQIVLAKWIQEALSQGTFLTTLSDTLGATEEQAQQAFQQLKKDAERTACIDQTLDGELDDDECDDEDFRADEFHDLGGKNREVAFADGVVPEDLRTSLEKHLDEIAALPDKDFHPGTEGLVGLFFSAQALTLKFPSPNFLLNLRPHLHPPLPSPPLIASPGTRFNTPLYVSLRQGRQSGKRRRE
jgi:hypothetical protein